MLYGRGGCTIYHFSWVLAWGAFHTPPQTQLEYKMRVQADQRSNGELLGAACIPKQNVFRRSIWTIVSCPRLRSPRTSFCFCFKTATYSYRIRPKYNGLVGDVFPRQEHLDTLQLFPHRQYAGIAQLSRRGIGRRIGPSRKRHLSELGVPQRRRAVQRQRY